MFITPTMAPSDRLGEIESSLDAGEPFEHVEAQIDSLDFLSVECRDTLALYAWAWAESGRQAADTRFDHGRDHLDHVTVEPG